MEEIRGEVEKKTPKKEIDNASFLYVTRLIFESLSKVTYYEI